MNKSFRKYVNNRIIEDADYNKISDAVNQLIVEKGHITPEDLQEGFGDFMRGIGGAFTGLGKMGSDMLDKTNDTLDSAGGKISDMANKGTRYVGNAFKNVAKDTALNAYKTGQLAKNAYSSVNNSLEKAKNNREIVIVTGIQKELNDDSAFKKLPLQNQKILNAILNKMRALA